MDLSDKPGLGGKEDLAGSCVAIGAFDGCHLGHKDLFDACISEARANGAKSAIVTFDIDPDELFFDDPKKIMTNDQRIDALIGSGVDSVIAIKFDEAAASFDPDEFLDLLFGENLPKSIHVGSDFRFGKRQSGNIDTLSRWCDANNVSLHVHELVEMDGAPVKSTRIRELLMKGDVEDAASLMGRHYMVCGPVKHGRGEGASFGFATANIDSGYLLDDGVYGGYAFVDGKRYKSAISVGVPPTFKDRTSDSLEAHILGYSGDLYGKVICVSFVKRLRPMIAFESTEELIAQVESDISYVENNL